jgi:hypothetical protein
MEVGQGPNVGCSANEKKYEVLTEFNLKVIDVDLFRLGKSKWEVTWRRKGTLSLQITQQLMYCQME